MNIKPVRILHLALLFGSMALAGQALAAPLYFNDAGGPLTWKQNDAAYANWSTVAGGPYAAVWTGWSDAGFEGTAGTVDVSGNVQFNSLQFDVTGYTIAGGTITIGNPTTPGFYVVSGGSALITSTMAQSGTGNTIVIGKAGYAGTLTLSGDASAVTRNFNVNYGTVIITRSDSLGSGTKTVSLTNGTAGHCQLHLDGSGGDITLPNTISFMTSNMADPGTIYNLAGNNTIGGNFTLTSGGGGTRFVVNAGSLTLNGAISANQPSRALALAGAGNGIVAGVIADGAAAYTVTKEDAGQWTLSGANLYTGTTVVNAGTLTVSGSLANANITITGGKLDGAGTLNCRLTDDTADRMRVSGSGTIDISSLTLNLVRTGAQSLTEYVLLNDLTKVTGGAFLSTTLPPYWHIDYDGTAANPNAIVLVFDVAGASREWDGGDAAAGTWSAAANWAGDGVPGDGGALVFPASAARQVNTNDTLTAVRSLTLGGGYTLLGNPLTPGGAVQSAGTNTLALPLTLNGPKLFDIASGTLTLASTVGGAGGIGKAGAGTLNVISGSSYAGDTIVSNGVLHQSGVIPTGALPVSGASLWLRADGLTGLADGAAVATWTDESGMTNHATQATAANRPTYRAGVQNGLPVVRFDGTDDRLAYNGAVLVNTDYTIFIVEGRTDPKANNYVLRGSVGTTDQNLHVGYRVNATFTHAQYNNDYDMPVAGYTLQQFNVLALDLDATGGSGRHTWRNGTLLGAKANNTRLGAYVNSSIGGYTPNMYKGDVAEVVMYRRALSAQERRQVETYLMSKWLPPVPYASTLRVAQPGAVELNGRKLQVAGLGDAGGAGGVVVNSATNPVTLTVNGSTTNTFSGAICEAASGTVSLTKAGTGALTLAGTNTYSGPTTVNAGTLACGCDHALPAATVLTLGSGNTVGHLGALNQALGSLTVSPYSTATNVITIGSGTTLTVNGNVAIGNNAAANTTTYLTLRGGGSFVVNSVGGTFKLGLATGNANYDYGTTDMRGLGAFALNLGTTGTLRVGNTAGTSMGGPFYTTLILATNSSITAGTVGVGDATGQGGNIGVLRLGSGTNAINADVVNIGQAGTSRSSGQVVFDTATGSLTLRGSAGGNSRANTVNILNHTSATGTLLTGLLELADHPAHLLIGTLTLAKRVGNSALGDTGTLTFDTGTLDVTTVVAGSRSSTGGTSAGTLNIGGGTAIVGTGGITLATSTVAGSTANGTVNLTGGNVTVNGNITKGASTGAGTATLNLDGATLDLTGHTIGGAAPALVTAAFKAGTVSNIAEINNGASGLTKTTAGTLTLAGDNRYTGVTTINAGTLALAGNDVLRPQHNIVLGGGTLDTGTGENHVGTLTLAGDVVSTIRVVPGSKLSFAESRESIWGGQLAIEGTLTSTSLRVGTDRNGLTDVQLQQISAGGRPVSITATGYLVTSPPGTVITVR